MYVIVMAILDSRRKGGYFYWKCVGVRCTVSCLKIALWLCGYVVMERQGTGTTGDTWCVGVRDKSFAALVGYRFWGLRLSRFG